jgi:hypothetical protein
MQQLLDQVHMSEYHPSAAVSLQVQLVKSVPEQNTNQVSKDSREMRNFREPFRHIFRQESKISIPLIAHDFAARKAANRDNLGLTVSRKHSFKGTHSPSLKV